MKTLHTNYKLDSGAIALTVVVGNGQRGNTLVAVGDRVLANGPDITSLNIGEGSTLTNQTLTVITTVSQTNPELQEAVVTYKLRGGRQPRDYSLDDEFAGGKVQIQCVATFDLTAGT